MVRTLRLQACCVCTLSLATTCVDFNTPPLRAKPRKDQQKKKTQTIRCTNTTLVLKTNKHLLSLSSSRIHGLKDIANFGVGKCSKFRVASCHCVAPCLFCHDPFIVRSARTSPPFTGFTQLTHPSQCSRSTLKAVCFCVHDLPPLVSVFFTRSIIGSSAFIL